MRCVCSSTVPCVHLSRQALRVFCRGLARSHLHRIVLLGKETFSRTLHHVERTSRHLETRTPQGTSPSTVRGCIPEMNDRISAARSKVLTIWRPGHAQGPIKIGGTRRHRIAHQKMPGRGVPHLHGFPRVLFTGIAGCRGEAHPCWRPRLGPDGSCLATIGQQVMPACRVPHFYGSILACRGDARAIGGPRHRSHRSSMNCRGKEATPTPCIPHLHRTVIAARSNTLALR